MEIKNKEKAGKILIVDDEILIRRFLMTLLSGKGYAAHEAADGYEAIEMIERDQYDLAILDLKMPGKDGIEVLREIKTRRPETYVIMMTGHGTKETAMKALSMGAFYYITKPFESVQKLLEIVGMAMKEISEKKEMLSDPDNSVRALVAMSDISHALNSSLDVVELMDTFIKKTKTLFDYDYLAILAAAQDAEERRPYKTIVEKGRYFDGLDEDCLRQHILDKYVSFRDKAAESHNISDTVFNNESDCAEAESAGIFSHITLPLIYGNNVLGIVSMGSRRPDVYSIETSRLLSTLVNQFASSLNNCLLYEGMKNAAMMDGLTNIHNHRYFKQMMEYEFSKTKRFKTPLSCIMMDIDNFKKINDTFGHQAGDDILSDMAAIIKGLVRKVDTLARYGGEEFVIICPHTDNAEASILAERIRTSVSNNNFITEKGPVRVTLSLGVASFTSENRMNDNNQLIKLADNLLYLAKTRGKNRVENTEGFYEFKQQVLAN